MCYDISFVRKNDEMGGGMSDGGWFRKKKKGVGWTPNNWKGWTVLVIGIAIVIALAKILVGSGG